MILNKSIFKAYDIRGVYPSQLNSKTAFFVGMAFAQKTKAKEVVIGRDMRLGGNVLKKSLMAGLSAGGVKKIIDIGLVPIDAIYFAVGKLKHETGIMITASHNPKEYNGFKMMAQKMKVVRGEQLFPLAQRLAELNSKKKNTKVKIVKENIWPGYIKHVLSFADIKKIKPFKVVVDAGNGMAGKVMPILTKKLPIKIIPLNFQLDSTFPAHPSNPLEPQSQIQIVKKVKETKADCGVIFDGDTDRLFFVDEKGRFVPADITLLILAEKFLEKEPGAGVVYNLICSKIIVEKVREWGGRPIRTAVGYVNVAEGMRKNKGIMGGELSAHYSFRDNSYADSGFIALIILLELLSKKNKPLSEIIKPLNKYYKLPEINTRFDKREEMDGKIRQIKNNYKKYKQDCLDGVTVDSWDKGGWWFNLRASNTEPLLRLTIESKNKTTAEKVKKEVLNILAI
ncbi:phosphomannomutase/phosphoglucomutase [Candidatus Kuenenbacteria bacterium]|nr:phosphomannomutase/phosphoglucomutase [Candidatus Kuenenbacteria bacterium]